jgi:hypothetical protein
MKEFYSGHSFQAKGLVHTSPGQRPGNTRDVIWSQANGLPHLAMKRAFSAGNAFFLAHKPRALPWAGMSDAVGDCNSAVMSSSLVWHPFRRSTKWIAAKMWVMTRAKATVLMRGDTGGRETLELEWLNLERDA